MRMMLPLAIVSTAILATAPAGLAHDGKDHTVVSGKVTKVDEPAGKITIAHQAIPNLQMEAMTMVFKAADPAMTKQVKAGDAIKFSADRVNGQLTVTEIEKAR